PALLCILCAGDSGARSLPVFHARELLPLRGDQFDAHEGSGGSRARRIHVAAFRDPELRLDGGIVRRRADPDQRTRWTAVAYGFGRTAVDRRRPADTRVDADRRAVGPAPDGRICRRGRRSVLTAEQTVARHYTRGSLEESLLEGRRSGKN